LEKLAGWPDWAVATNEEQAAGRHAWSDAPGRSGLGADGEPVAGVEKQRTRSTGDLEVFSPEEVMALVRASASEQDGAIYLTAAFTVCAAASCSRCGGATSSSPAR
jgi:hypothetical protein